MLCSMACTFCPKLFFACRECTLLQKLVRSQWLQQMQCLLPYVSNCISSARLPTASHNQTSQGCSEQNASEGQALPCTLIMSWKGVVSLLILSSVVMQQLHAASRSLRVYREACLKGQGFWDPFKPVKDEENKKALKLLPGVLK